MIIVTGGAGLIGSNLIRELNNRGVTNILCVDDLSCGKKSLNLASCYIDDYVDKRTFIDMIKEDEAKQWRDVSAIYHLGACSATTEWDGRYLMQNNYQYSKLVADFARRLDSVLVYASSASVYGLGKRGFLENESCESPINMYAYSKWQFDMYMRTHLIKRQPIVGLRYFNVYGYGESHKGSMASTIMHFYNQMVSTNVIRVFGEGEGYGPGRHSRDFVYIDDVVDITLWFGARRLSGIFNVGTGVAREFNCVAHCVADWFYRNKGARAKIEYIPFPDNLKGSYQAYTEARIDNLRSIGYSKELTLLEQGVERYLAKLEGID